MIRVGLIGDYNPQVKAHIAIPKAIQLAVMELGSGYEAECEWIPTSTLEKDYERALDGYQKLWVVPASPYESMQGALNGIRYARERKIPMLGTCGGFQHMILEIARHMLGHAEADHSEMNPEASSLWVTPLTCTVSETTNEFFLVPGSQVASIYGAEEVIEQYGTCNYGPNPEFAPLLEKAGFRVAGRDGDGETRIMELDGHPFFIGALFQPERSAFRDVVHPLIRAFIGSATV
ncbi:hypothetical protein D7Z26_22475 [Cohnella endophytica]|uniref:CTP synthase (glutamine hydrolyzing) n=1 Tax=Cohnella endophytica TaxID=2419778 RepID=A0A494XB44_9BACL|nr:hypothetical protein [Cohnella endophytica]RKP47975.1 hypothetical protein D7Z26_22475 [Cohnella endophytica]